MQRLPRGKVDSQLLLQSPDHIIPLPRPLKLQLHRLGPLLALIPIWMIHDFRLPTRQILHQPLHHRLRDIHQILHIRIRHVKFTNRKLGVMRQIDPFVPKHAPNLVDAVQPTDDELLQVQLWRDAQEQVQPKVVVVGDERLGSCTASEKGRDGRLDLHEPHIIEEPSDIVDNLGASDEQLACGVVEDEVKVSLAVPRLLVLEAEMGRRQLVQIGREEGNDRWRDAQLALFGAGGGTSDADYVTPFEVLVGGDE